MTASWKQPCGNVATGERKCLIKFAIKINKNLWLIDYLRIALGPNAAQSLTPAMQMRREGNGGGGFGSCHLHWVSKRHWDSLGTPEEDGYSRNT